MTIVFGWWLAPLAVTVAAFTWQRWVHRNDKPAYGYGTIGAGIGGLLTFSAATVVSLTAWLAYALAT